MVTGCAMPLAHTVQITAMAIAVTTRRNAPARDYHARAGRALIELIVSALLLSVAATATLSLLQLTVSASVRISDLTAARDLARDLAEETVANPCTAAAGAASRSRIAANWTPSTVQQSVNLSLTVNFAPRPGAVSAPRTLDAVLAGWCP